MFPSHPPLPPASALPTVVDVSLDPRGWTYTAVSAGFYDNLIQPLFPDLSFWSCQISLVSVIPGTHAAGPVFLTTALYLTVTSTSHEAGPTTTYPAVPSKLPYSGHEPVQKAPSQPTQNASLIDTQGSLILCTTPAGAIGVLQTSTIYQGQSLVVTSSVSLTFSTPVMTISQVVTSTNAQGSIVSSNTVSQYTTSSQTLTPGGAITVFGTPISLAPSATALVIGTSTQQLVTGATSLPTLSISTPTVSPNTVSQYTTSSQTLTPGGIITLSGTPISLAPSATALIIGSNTIPLDSSTVLPPPLTIGSQVFTARIATQYIIGSQTLTPGGVITVSGTIVSLAPGDTAAVVGTSTEGLGALITAGLGSGPGNGDGNGTAKSTGGARALGISGITVCLEGFLLLLGLGIVVGL